MYNIEYKIGTKIYQIEEYTTYNEDTGECEKCEGFGYFKTLGTESKVKCRICGGTGKQMKKVFEMGHRSK